MKFNIGAELDKQIYKEGESTWGCKSGVLDVEDVKECFCQLKEEIRTMWMKNVKNKLVRFHLTILENRIKELVGEKLL